MGRVDQECTGMINTKNNANFILGSGGCNALNWTPISHYRSEKGNFTPSKQYLRTYCITLHTGLLCLDYRSFLLLLKQSKMKGGTIPSQITQSLTRTVCNFLFDQ